MGVYSLFCSVYNSGLFSSCFYSSWWFDSPPRKVLETSCPYFFSTIYLVWVPTELVTFDNASASPDIAVPAAPHVATVNYFVVWSTEDNWLCFTFVIRRIDFSIHSLSQWFSFLSHWGVELFQDVSSNIHNHICFVLHGGQCRLGGLRHLDLVSCIDLWSNELSCFVDTTGCNLSQPNKGILQYSSGYYGLNTLQFSECSW